MANINIAYQRLLNQRLIANPFEKPEDVVRWFGAVQAQDFLGSLWALGLRMHEATEECVEQAVIDRKIVRSWPLRGTLHYAAAEDIHWMVALVGPRTIERAASRYRQLGLDEETLMRSSDVIVKALQTSKQLTRPKIKETLEEAGIATDGQRLIHMLGHAALQGLTCYASRDGKQFTFALLEEWAPPTQSLERDESLAVLARRYFTSHGPATVQDYIWWTGLTAADARAGHEMVKPELNEVVIDGTSNWFAGDIPAAFDMPETAYLLPPFDEYLVSYKDRTAVLDPAYADRLSALLSPTILFAGRVIGTWKRTLKKDSVVVAAKAFTAFTDVQRDAVEDAAQRYGEFLGLPITFSVSDGD